MSWPAYHLNQFLARERKLDFMAFIRDSLGHSFEAVSWSFPINKDPASWELEGNLLWTRWIRVSFSVIVVLGFSLLMSIHSITRLFLNPKNSEFIEKLTDRRPSPFLFVKRLWAILSKELNEKLWNLLFFKLSNFVQGYRRKIIKHFSLYLSCWYENVPQNHTTSIYVSSCTKIFLCYQFLYTTRQSKALSKCTNRCLFLLRIIEKDWIASYVESSVHEDTILVNLILYFVRILSQQLAPINFRVI